jgi:FkbM family methyltransferase
MIKNLSFFFYKILFYFDKFFLLLTKKSFLIWFKDFIEEDSYKSIYIHKKKVIFFVPNQITKFRYDTFFSKEPETLKWIDNFKKKNLIFWDIGANIGLYSIYNSLKNASSKTFSFEPSSSNLRILTRNISINNLQKKISIIPLPLTNKENAFQIMNEKAFVEGSALHAFGKNLDFQGKKFSPNMKYTLLGTTVNFLIENRILKVPDYIKIDVDGIEHLILRASNKILKNKKVKSLNIEINENYKNQYNTIINLMRKYNFKFFRKYNNLKYAKNNKFSNTFNYIFIR